MVKCGVLFEVRTEFLNHQSKAEEFLENVSVYLSTTLWNRMANMKRKAFLTSEWDEDDWSASRYCHFNPMENTEVGPPIEQKWLM
jgi:hypothetical protein